MRSVLYIIVILLVATACSPKREADRVEIDLHAEAKSHSQQAKMYVECGMMDEASAEIRKAIAINKTLNDTTALISNYLVYARCSDSINNEIQYLRTLISPNHLDHWREVRLELSKAYYLRAFYHIAPPVLMEQKPISRSGRDKVETLILEAYNAYNRQEYEAAKEYAHKIIEIGTKYDRLCAWGFIEECSVNKTWKDKNSVPLLLDISNYRHALYNRIKESMHEQAERLKASYEYEKQLEEQRIALEEARLKQAILVLGLLLSALTFGLLIYVIYNRYKEQREEQARRLQNLELQRQRSEQYYESLHEESLRQIASLQEKLSASDAQNQLSGSNLTQERMLLIKEDFYADLLRTHKAGIQEWRIVMDFFQRESPDFLAKLQNVALMDEEELHISLLIRMGFSQSATADIINKTPQAINYIRRKLAAKALGTDIASVKADLWNQVIEGL